MMSQRMFILLFLVLIALVSTSCDSQGPIGATVGKPAPDFSLPDLNGKTWALSELKGKVVFVNFWATWCPPCRDEMPSMQRLLERMPADKFEMLAVLNRDTPTNAELFVNKLEVTMPILNDMGNNIGLIFGLTGLPETFIVDKQGILREKFIGPARWDSPEFIQMMTKYINE